MKTRVLFKTVAGLSLSLILSSALISCTRKSNSGSSKLTIQFPESGKSDSREKTVSQNLSAKPNFDTTNSPTSYDNVDCLVVFVGGPEDTMRNNYCEKEVDKSNHFNFGLFAGSFARGENISMEIPSGNDRVIRLYGMKKSATATGCPQISGGNGADSALAGFSPPYFLGEKGGILMSPGSEITVNVSVNTTIDSNAYFDKCEGPSMGGGQTGNPGGGGSTPNNPGSGSTNPYVRLEGLYQFGHWENNAHLSIKPLTLGQCIPVSIKTYQSGNNYFLSNPLTITFPAATDVLFYLGDSSCVSAGLIVSSVTLAAGSNQNSGNLYMKLNNFALTQYDFALIRSTAEVEYHSDGAFAVGKPKMKVDIPAQLVNNVCYPFTLHSFEADGVTPMPYSGSVNISNSAGSVYTGKTDLTTCNAGTATSAISFTSNSDSMVHYIQTPASGGFSGSLSITGPAPVLSLYDMINVSYAQTATGDILPTQLGFSMPSTMEANTCQRISVKLLNRGTLNVPAPTAINVSLAVSNRIRGTFHSNSTCFGGKVDAVMFNPGDYSKDIYFMARSPEVSLSLTGVTDYLAIKTLGPNFDIVPPSNNRIYISSAPVFGDAKYIGSHEFGGLGGMLPVSVAIPAGAILKCIRESDQMPCDGQISGQTFNWYYSDAKNNTNFRLISNLNGITQEVRFSPNDLYGTIMYKDCDHTHTGGSVASTAITSAGGAINCFDNNAAIISMSSPINLNGIELIGHSFRTGTIVVNSSYNVSIGAGSSALIANMTFQHLPTTTASALLYITSISSNVEINNSHFQFDATASGMSYGLYISGVPGSVNLYNVTMNATSGTASNGALVDIVNSNNVNIDGLTINNASTTMSGVSLHGGSTRDAKITYFRKYKYSGSGQRALSFDASGPTFYSKVDLATEFDLTSSFASAGLIEMQGYSSLVLRNSILEKTQPTRIIDMIGSSTSITLLQNTFIQPFDQPVISMIQGVISDMVDNHFVRSGGATVTSFPFSVTAVPTINSTAPNSNLFCSDSATWGWVAGTKVSGAISGSYNANSSQLSNNGPNYMNNKHCTYRN